MDIPFTVKNRPDTGLYNAKIGIWLFLASEIMLFGGLFSAYVYLRLGADFPWPWHELVIWPGLTNTAVLIGSSVTVLMAWVSLKLREYTKYKIYMALTIICAGLFMVLKSYEYDGKFNHYAIKLKDGSIIDGHEPGHVGFWQGLLGLGHDDHGHGHDAHGAHAPGFDDIVFEKVSKVTLSLKNDQQESSTADFLDDLASEGTKFKLASGQVVEVDAAFIKSEVKKYKASWKEANAKRADLESDQWGKIRPLQAKVDQIEKDGRNRWSNAKAEAAKAQIDEETKGLLAPVKAELDALMAPINKLKADRDSLPTSLVLTLDPPATFHVERGNARRGWSKSELTYTDGTIITGELKDDSIKLLVSGWDIRQMKGLKEDLNLADKAMVWNYLPDEKAILTSQRHEADEKFKKQFGGKSKSDGQPYVPADRPEVLREGFTSRRSDPGFELSHASDSTKAESKTKFNVDRKWDTTVSVKQEDIKFYTNYSSKNNTYYAIYFLMTGLHGLHVIGGALVLAYFLFFGRKMYETDPERLANRVEVGGLFWHFVDLVWIFLFPLYYLL